QKNKVKESGRSRVSKTEVSVKQTNPVKKGQTIYKIQILTSDKKLSPGSKLFKGYKNVDCFIEKGIYKYTYGETTSFDSIRKLRRQVAKDFKDAFIVAFKDGKKVKY
ncbi:N-acetylmuramoyl-L-alanine amidase, partial [Parabacteroides merdae]|nr:N-acetylmuramoyl-L-alanine amidase [Parabacteroides merdae]